MRLHHAGDNPVLQPGGWPLWIATRTDPHTLSCCAPHRYEDNFDAVNNVAVTATPIDKSDITQLGSPDQFAEKLGFLFGKQAFQGAW